MCGLLNDDIGESNCKSSNGRTLYEWRIGLNVEGDVPDLIWHTMATYACNWTEQTRHCSVRAVPHFNPHLLSTSYNLQRLIQLSLRINSIKMEADMTTLILSSWPVHA